MRGGEKERMHERVREKWRLNGGEQKMTRTHVPHPREMTKKEQ